MERKGVSKEECVVLVKQGKKGDRTLHVHEREEREEKNDGGGKLSPSRGPPGRAPRPSRQSAAGQADAARHARGRGRAATGPGCCAPRATRRAPGAPARTRPNPSTRPCAAPSRPTCPGCSGPRHATEAARTSSGSPRLQPSAAQSDPGCQAVEKCNGNR